MSYEPRPVYLSQPQLDAINERLAHAAPRHWVYELKRRVEKLEAEQRSCIRYIEPEPSEGMDEMTTGFCLGVLITLFLVGVGLLAVLV